MPGVKWVPRESWHLTIGYYGTDEPEPRKAWVRERLDGLVAPRISLSDMGNFRDTLLMKVSTPDSSLAGLAAALRGSDKHREYQPHLTIGYGAPLAMDYSGPEWTITEVVLLGASERYRYTVLDRFCFS